MLQVVVGMMAIKVLSHPYVARGAHTTSSKLPCARKCPNGWVATKGVGKTPGIVATLTPTWGSFKFILSDANPETWLWNTDNKMWSSHNDNGASPS